VEIRFSIYYLMKDDLLSWDWTLKEELQYLYKGGIVRLRYIPTRYDNPEDIKS
jgi:hypothetical protein